MRPRQPTPPPRPKSVRSYFVLAIIFTLTAVGIWLYINQDNIREFSETYKSREQAREKIAQTKQLITKLTRRQQSLNLNGLESKKQMRERLQLHLRGEQVIYFDKEEITTNTAPGTPGTTSTAQDIRSASQPQ